MAKSESHELKTRLILAPLADITDAPFRRICKKCGADFTYTQMISAGGVIRNSFETLKLLAFNRREKPIGVQLLGNDPDKLEAAVREIIPFQPDEINLNCGCPVPNMSSLNMGAALLEDPILLSRLINRLVKAAAGLPVSVKVRLGRSQKKINVLETAKIAEQEGASSIIVHARARNNSYAESSDWTWIKKTKEQVSIPVIGNGSVFEPLDIVNMIEQTGCDGVMIARGALGNPFIFARTKQLLETGTDPGEPSVDEIKESALAHIKMAIEDAGEMAGILRIKKHLIWYFMYFGGLEDFTKQIYSLSQLEGIVEAVEKHVQAIKNGAYPAIDKELISSKFYKKILFWMEN